MLPLATYEKFNNDILRGLRCIMHEGRCGWGQRRL